MEYQTVVDFETGARRLDMVRRSSDGACIPADAENTDWRAYQAWLAEGNVPAEPDAIAPPRPTGA